MTGRSFGWSGPSLSLWTKRVAKLSKRVIGAFGPLIGLEEDFPTGACPARLVGEAHHVKRVGDLGDVGNIASNTAR